MPLKQKLYCRTLGCKMSFAVKGILRLLNKRFAEADIELTLEQFYILNILENEEGLILQDLADIVDRDKSAVLRHLNCLEEKHFVARAEDPEDRRRKILLVTKPGMETLDEARQIDDQVNSEITDSIPKKEQEHLENAISVIYRYTMSDDIC